MNRLVLSIGAILLVARAFDGQTTNALPKYDASGHLVASSLSEVGGSVGIGTATPASKFNVVGGMTYLQPTSVGPNQGLQLDTAGLANGSNGVLVDAPAGWAGNYISSNLNGIQMFRVAHDGSAFFGGNVFVNGNIAAKFQDVAEWVQARVPLADGTVVVASGAEDNVVESSAREYDGAVVGVVSLQPGIVLGESSPGAVLIAHTGRVRVKVDASYGAVRRGDALTTSPTPGYAMRSTPFDIGGVPIHRPGTLLGKALEPLESGTGEILVLLTLQ